MATLGAFSASQFKASCEPGWLTNKNVGMTARCPHCMEHLKKPSQAFVTRKMTAQEKKSPAGLDAQKKELLKLLQTHRLVGKPINGRNVTKGLNALRGKVLNDGRKRLLQPAESTQMLALLEEGAFLVRPEEGADLEGRASRRTS